MSDFREPLDQARLAEELPQLQWPVDRRSRSFRRPGRPTPTCSTGRPRACRGAILVAEEQTAGPGRLGRSWVSPPGAALTFSVLLRPDAIPPTMRGWLPLIAGIATATAVRALTGLDGVPQVAERRAHRRPQARRNPRGSPRERRDRRQLDRHRHRGQHLIGPRGAARTAPAGCRATSLLAEGIAGRAGRPPHRDPAVPWPVVQDPLPEPRSRTDGPARPSTPACPPQWVGKSTWNCQAARWSSGVAAGIDPDGQLLLDSGRRQPSDRRRRRYPPSLRRSVSRAVSGPGS